MKQIKSPLLNVLALSILFWGCQKQSQDSTISSETAMAGNSNQPIEMFDQPHGLGAIMHDRADYLRFEKLDVKALKAKKTKEVATSTGTATATITASNPPSYQIPGNTPGNQGREGSCVAWAVAYAASSALEHNFKGFNFPMATRSPEYVYNQIKVSGSCGSGSYISRGLDLIKNQGVCSWSEMPYTDADCRAKPNAKQKNAASTHKLVSWSRIDNTILDDVKSLLNMNIPVIIGVTVDGTFDNMGATGWVWSNHGGTVRGGHAITVMGYDDNLQAFKVQNSWGTVWGQSGYFWITYSFFANGAVNEAYAAYVQ